MGKETGLGNQLYLDGYDLSGDTNAISKISKAINLLEMTGIDKSAVERKAGQLDGGIDWVSFWNPTNAHTALDDITTKADRVASFFHRSALAVPACSIVCKQTDYAPNRANDGALLADVSTVANSFWLDWGLACTAGKRTDTAATNGTGVDFTNWGGGNSFGLQAYLQVFSFTGTSCTVKLQGSSDDGAGDAYADITGGAFTAATGRTSQRIETSRTQAIENWVRVVTTGTFSECTFAVHVTANATDMAKL